MRVGFDARWYNDSGVGVYVAELLRAMAQLSRDFELVVYEDPQNPVPGLDGLPIVRIQVCAPKYSISEQLELRRRCRQDKLDVFHSPFYVAPLGLHCPLVVTVHDLIPFLFRIYPRPKQWMVKLGYRPAVRRSPHPIFDSSSTAQDVRENLGVPEARVTAGHMAASHCFQAEEQARGMGTLQGKKRGPSP